MSGGMFGRLFAWIANDVIIHTLSNSKRFQQFAMRTDAHLTRHKEMIDNHVINPSEELIKGKVGELKKVNVSSFIDTFKKEMSKEMNKLNSKK